MRHLKSSSLCHEMHEMIEYCIKKVKDPIDARLNFYNVTISYDTDNAQRRVNYFKKECKNEIFKGL